MLYDHLTSFDCEFAKVEQQNEDLPHHDFGPDWTRRIN